MSLNPRLVRESFAPVKAARGKAAAYFHGRLFAEHPHMRALFPPAMDAHNEHLVKALTKIVSMLDDPDGLRPYLARLGRDHRKYGVTAEHFLAAGDALLATVKRFAADLWNEEVEAAWSSAYALAAQEMIAGAEADPGPPWWHAEVIGHERRTAEIAVVTVRPAERLAFKPGQHVPVQTARWPRIWRTFFIANAPRRDNTLRFHVRALPSGWVSSALVRYTRVGDQIMLGPPTGIMVPADTGRDILCVADGTGLAPMKAIIEHALQSGGASRIHLLLCARRAAEFYDMAELKRMTAAHPKLRVVPVVSDDPSFPGMRATPPEAVERLGPWEEHEVYLCGPAATVAETVRRLRRAGVPRERIHYDTLRDQPWRPPARNGRPPSALIGPARVR